MFRKYLSTPCSQSILAWFVRDGRYLSEGARVG